MSSNDFWRQRGVSWPVCRGVESPHLYWWLGINIHCQSINQYRSLSSMVHHHQSLPQLVITDSIIITRNYHQSLTTITPTDFHDLDNQPLTLWQPINHYNQPLINYHQSLPLTAHDNQPPLFISSSLRFRSIPVAIRFRVTWILPLATAANIGMLGYDIIDKTSITYYVYMFIFTQFYIYIYIYWYHAISCTHFSIPPLRFLLK